MSSDRTKVTPKPDVENPPSSKTNDDGSNHSMKRKLSIHTDGDLIVEDSELEKLVPVLLEDASDGNVVSVRQILDLDAKTPNFSIATATDDEGRHALHRAALEGQFEVLNILIERFGATTDSKGNKYIDVPDKYGNTALFLVCIRLDKSDEAQAQYLMDCGASVEIIKTSDNMTVLHWAAHHGNKKLVLALLKHHKTMFRPKSTCKLALLVDKDMRTPIDVAGLRYAQKWVEADDAMRGDSLVTGEDAKQLSSLDDFKIVIEHLCNPGNAARDEENPTLLLLALSMTD